MNSFIAKFQKSQAKSEIVGVIFNTEDKEEILKSVALLGVDFEATTEQTGVTLLTKQDAGDKDVSLVAVSEDLLVAVSPVLKGFSPWRLTSNFSEAIAGAGFFPSMRIASDALMDTVYANLEVAESEEIGKTKSEEAIDEFSAYAKSLLQQLPSVFFKFDAQVGLEKKMNIKKELKLEAMAGDLAALQAPVVKADEPVVEKTEVAKADEVVVEASAEVSGDPAAEVEAKTEEPVVKADEVPATEKSAEEFAALMKTTQDLAGAVTTLLTHMKGLEEKIDVIEKAASQPHVIAVDHQNLTPAGTPPRQVKKNADDLWSGALSQLDQFITR